MQAEAPGSSTVSAVYRSERSPHCPLLLQITHSSSLRSHWSQVLSLQNLPRSYITPYKRISPGLSCFGTHGYDTSFQVVFWRMRLCFKPAYNNIKYWFCFSNLFGFFFGLLKNQSTRFRWKITKGPKRVTLLIFLLCIHVGGGVKGGAWRGSWFVRLFLQCITS